MNKRAVLDNSHCYYPNANILRLFGIEKHNCWVQGIIHDYIWVTGSYWMCCLLKKGRIRELLMIYNMLSYTDPARKTEGQLLKEYLNLNVFNQFLQYGEQLIISNRQFWQKKQAHKRKYATVCILHWFTMIRRCSHSQTLTQARYILIHISRKGSLGQSCLSYTLVS